MSLSAPPLPAPDTSQSKLDVRLFKPSDYDEVRSLCADNFLQLSRFANSRAYRHPFFIALVVSTITVLSLVTKSFEQGDWGKLLLQCAMPTAIYLVMVEYHNYDKFNKLTTELVQSDDFRGLQQGEKGVVCWVARLGKHLIGCVVVRVDYDHQDGHIIHWNVIKAYRQKGLGSDLLEYAIKYGRTHKLKQLKCETNSLQNLAEKTLKKNGWAIIDGGYFNDWLLSLCSVKRHFWTLELQ